MSATTSYDCAFKRTYFQFAPFKEPEATRLMLRHLPHTIVTKTKNANDSDFSRM